MTNAQIFNKLKSEGFTLTSISGPYGIWMKDGFVTKGPSRSNDNHGDSAWLHKCLRTIEAARIAELAAKPRERKITRGEIRVGARVRSRRAFVDVAAGTLGTITDDYGSGFTILWDRPGLSPLSDFFDKSTELHYLELV